MKFRDVSLTLNKFFSMTISWPVATMLLPANVERLLDVLF